MKCKYYFSYNGNIYDALDKLFKIVSYMKIKEILYKLEGDKILYLNDDYYIEDIMCPRCVESVCNFGDELYDFYGGKVGSKYIHSIAKHLGTSFDEVEIFFRDRRKLLYLITYWDTPTLYYSKSCLGRLGRDDYCDHYRERVLYVDCLECFRVYKKILDLFDKFEIAEFEIKLKLNRINLADNDDDGNINISDNDNSFIQHMCKSNNLNNLLNIINTQVEFPISVDEAGNIVRRKENKIIKNAKSRIDIL